MTEIAANLETWTLSMFLKNKGYKHSQIAKQVKLSRITYEKKLANVELFNIAEVMLLAHHFNMPFIELAENLHKEYLKKSTYGK